MQRRLFTRAQAPEQRGRLRERPDALHRTVGHATFGATGKSSVRFAAWDSAGNGAFVQPVWLMV